jgi:hypothetical protein
MAVILLSNLQMDMLVNSFKKIFEVVLGETEKPAAGIGLDKAENQDITGSYLLHALDYINESRADISERNGHLFIRFPGEEEMELLRTGLLEYDFTSPASRLPGEILFEKDESGGVGYMRYFWASWEKVK